MGRSFYPHSSPALFSCAFGLEKKKNLNSPAHEQGGCEVEANACCFCCLFSQSSTDPHATEEGLCENVIFLLVQLGLRKITHIRFLYGVTREPVAWLSDPLSHMHPVRFPQNI